jgi:acyl dehydratase
MALRTLERSPGLLSLYARAAAPLLPGTSLLGFLSGGGGEIPDLELELPGVQVDPAHLASYTAVCAMTMRERLPATYLHVLAFPLHMALMTDSSFPFGAIGLVHVSNRIAQRRPVRVEEELDFRVRATPLQSHPRGRTFSIVSEARVGEELVWEEESTMLRRGGTPHDATDGTAAGRDEKLKDEGAEREAEGGPDQPLGLPLAAEWKLPGDLGRRYASASGDRNPIHLHALSAKAFGFPRAIAHGMWTKARCMAALEQLLPGAFSVTVRFRRPILLPGKVAFGTADEADAVDFSVTDLRSGTPHLEGRLEPIADQQVSNRGRVK